MSILRVLLELPITFKVTLNSMPCHHFESAGSIEGLGFKYKSFTVVLHVHRELNSAYRDYGRAMVVATEATVTDVRLQELFAVFFREMPVANSRVQIKC